ncbi:MAG: single-stranded DNA-binding protein [Actinomycetota bacterium]
MTVVGNLCSDPELRETPKGVPVADLRIAENRNYQDSSGRWHQTSSFYSVVVWRRVAEHAAASLHRGDRVVAVGRMRQDEWTTETGQTRRRYVVDADELAASIRFVTVAVTRADGDMEEAS